VVAFVATPYSNTSAGTFVVYRGSSNAYGANDLVLAGEQPCSGYSIGCSLRGFEVIPSFTRDGVNTGWRLFVAWDRKGSIAAEVVTLDHLFQITPYVEPSHNNSLLSDWQPVSQGTEAEQFDAAYFDNLLGAAPPDSAEPYNNTDIGQTFLEHLFHPGRFSSLTLSTALDEYVQQLPRTHAIALASTSYPTLSRRFEAVVGCHLELELSPQTGAPVVEAYRQQLKLEWLGVWAAVRDLDRQARWPVTTTLIDGHVAIIAREGASVPVLEDGVGIINRLGDSQEASGDLRDLPDGALRHLYPDLAPPLARASMLALSAAGSFAVDILANRDAPNGEGSGLDLFVNEADLAFSTGPQQPAEFLAGQLWDDTAEQLLSDEDRMTLRRILSGCLDVRAAFGVTLHLISNFVLPLRGTLVSDLAFSGFGNSILASSISRVVENRYALARKVLLVALFSLTESADVIAEEGDEAEDMVEIVAQTMAAYHRMRVLKWVCDQTGEESKERAASRRSNKRKLNGGEDVLAEGLGSLNVREADEALDTDGYDVSYSLIHSLLARQSHQRIPRQSIDIYLETAIAYLSEISILEKKQTEIEPQVEDVRLAHAILVDDHPALAYGVTDLYPESAGMVYVRGRASVEQGDLDLAVRYLEKAAAGCKGEYIRSDRNWLWLISLQMASCKRSCPQ
jgi:nuclear pore complex protein Nup160